MATVVVTGAAGFLGSYLTKQLLGEGHTVIGLVRDEKTVVADEVARQRFNLLGVPPEHLSNFSLREGDLAEMDVEKVAKKLGSEVAALWHCAAMVNLSDKKADEIYKSNVLGTRNVLALAEALGTTLHHISTAYVAGSFQGVFREEDLDVGQEFRNPYERTKFEAEKMVRQAFKAERVKGNIYRLGIVIGDSKTGFTTSFLGYYQCLAAIIYFARQGMSSIRIKGKADGRLSLVPLDFVVSCLQKISQQVSGKTFHIVPPEPQTVGWWLQHSLAAVGLGKVEVIDPTLWQPTTVLEEQLHSKLAPFLPYMAGEPIFDGSNLLSAVPEAGDFKITADYVQKVVGFAVKKKFGQPVIAGTSV